MADESFLGTRGRAVHEWGGDEDEHVGVGGEGEEGEDAGVRGGGEDEGGDRGVGASLVPCSRAMADHVP